MIVLVISSFLVLNSHAKSCQVAVLYWKLFNAFPICLNFHQSCSSILTCFGQNLLRKTNTKGSYIPSKVFLSTGLWRQYFQGHKSRIDYESTIEFNQLQSKVTSRLRNSWEETENLWSVLKNNWMNCFPIIALRIQ